MKSAKYNCPLCGQYMDFIVVTFRNHLYIDGEKYPRMCFGCAHVPKDRIQKYDEEGSLIEDSGPFFTYKYLNTPEELFGQGSCDTLVQAKRCVRAVKLRLKEVGKKALSKLKLHRPEHEYEINDEHEQLTLARKKPKTKPQSQSKTEPKAPEPKKLVKKPRLAAKKIRRS